MRGALRVLPALLGAWSLLLPGCLRGQEVVSDPGVVQPPRAQHVFDSPVDGGPWIGTYAAERGRPFLTPGGHLRLTVEPGAPPPQSLQPSIPGPGRAFLFSAVVPGLGQRTMGEHRWIAYAAGEAWAWIQFLRRRKDGHALQRRYRDLAWLVARRVSSGPRVDGKFEYYEAMTQYLSSGAYDADPQTSGVQPELDPETYNGSMWILAKQIFFLDDPEVPVDQSSPQYQDALQYYRSRAYGRDFAWNWGANSLEQGEFSALIKESDERFRRSTTMIGVILANHLLSAVDALVTGRLNQVAISEPRLQLSLLPGPFLQDTFFLTLRIPSP